MSAKTSDIKQALAKKFCAPEFAIFYEVANGTGSDISNYADAMVFGLYPSRGLERMGIEIKVSRGDWLKELKNPAKAEALAGYCDRWWVVSTPDVVKEGELPPTWGLMEFKAGKFFIKVAAPKLQAKEPSRELLAGIMRRAGQRDEAMFEAQKQAALEQAVVSANLRAERAVRDASTELIRLKERIAEIKQITGLDMASWRPTTEYARALKLANEIMASSVGFYAQALQEELEKLNQACNTFAQSEVAPKEEPSARVRRKP